MDQLLRRPMFCISVAEMEQTTGIKSHCLLKRGRGACLQYSLVRNYWSH